MCYNPITLHTPSGNVLQVPCGHCLACLHKYQQDICIRLSEEVDTWLPKNGEEIPIVFATLTYSQNNIPKNYLFNSTHGPQISRDSIPQVSPISEVLPWNGTVKDFIIKRDPSGKVVEVVPRKEFKERVLSYEERFKFAAGLSGFCADIVEDGDHRFETEIPSEVDVDGLGTLPPAFFLSESEIMQHFDRDGRESEVIGDVIEVNSVRYSDVRDWIKRCRMAFERSREDHILTYYSPEYRPVRVSDRLNPYWTDAKGVKRFLPFSALTPTIHYYLSSEYGPVTLRPHYHGVFFGITLDEFKEYFVKDWEARFGHVDCSTFDPLKGGALYLSKYCAKGSFEHPLCSRDFFYPSGKEYHSNRFEGSIQRLGVDLAVCDPTFHLSSKGLGIRYAFKPSIQKFWQVKLYEDKYNKRPFYCVEDLEPSKLSTMDMMRVSFAVNSKTNVAIFSDVNELSFLQLQGFTEIGKYTHYEDDVKISRLTSLLRINKNGQITARSTFGREASFTILEELSSVQRQYAETYLQKNKVGEVVAKTRESALPRYYHRYLLSPAQRCARVASAIRLFAGISEQIKRECRQGRQGYVSVDEICEFVSSQETKQALSQKKLRKCANRFYSVLDRQDLLDLIAYEQHI